MRHFPRRSVITFFSLVCISVFMGAMCGGDTVDTPKAVTLTYWRVFDEENTLDPYMSVFQTEYPYVKIQVRNFSVDEYEEELLTAWARGEGPDMFSIPNFWLGKYIQFASPMPTELSVVKVETKKTLGRSKLLSTKETVRGLTPTLMKEHWVDAVAEDVVFGDDVYAVPFSIDTLVLYYNKDLLAQEGIAVPPETWQEFVEDVPKITVVNEQDQVLRSGAALGAHENVQRYFDILSVLMMQNGATMTDGGSVRFNGESELRGGYYPGLAATQFFTDFANPKKSVYSWTPDQPDSLEAFTSGQTAFFLGYEYHLDQVKQRAPSLNFGISALPQINQSQRVNYANYWVEAVALSSDHPDLAWAFLQSVAKQPEQYLLATKKVAALRNLVAQQQTDTTLSTFATAALTAKTWYHGKDPDEAERILADLIDTVRAGTSSGTEAVDLAAKQIGLTLDLN